MVGVQNGLEEKAHSADSDEEDLRLLQEFALGYAHQLEIRSLFVTPTGRKQSQLLSVFAELLVIDKSMPGRICSFFSVRLEEYDASLFQNLEQIAVNGIVKWVQTLRKLG